MATYNFDNMELLRAAKETAEQIGLQLDTIIKAVEDSIEAAARKKYGDHKIKATVDRKTGIISLSRELTVVDDSVTDIDSFSSISLSEAKLIKADVEVGEAIFEELPPVNIDHVSAKVAQQKIEQIIRDEERKKQYEEFKNRIGDIVCGLVKRIEYNNLIVDINGNDAYLRSSNLIKGELFRQGDRIKAYIEDVRHTSYGAQIFLSRVHKGFIEQLFKQEIPEVYDGLVAIKTIARDAGSRTKVAVFSPDKNIDPVGACVGIKGYRIRGIISELNGEKIDIIHYSPDLGQFIINAIAPAEVLKVIIDEDESRIELVIPESQLSIAIGRGGQNIRLASELVGWKVNILSDKEDSEKRTQELNQGSALFAEALNVEEIIGQLLVTEGFLSIEDIAQASISDLASIDGFNEEIAVALHDRAIQYLTDKQNNKETKLQELGVDQSIIELPYLQADDILTLYNNDIKTLEDLAGLSMDEFYGIISSSSLSSEEVNEIIIEARKKAGWLS